MSTIAVKRRRIRSGVSGAGPGRKAKFGVPMDQIPVAITSEQRRRLEALQFNEGQRTGIAGMSIADIIRAAIDHYTIWYGRTYNVVLPGDEAAREGDGHHA